MRYITLLIVLASSASFAQRDSIAGVYSLQGVQETASVFQLFPDSTFEFFYAYGALDRFGKGKWTVLENEVVLTGKPYPGKDFRIIGSKLVPGKGMELQLREKNPVFNNFFYARVQTTKKDTVLKADRNGVIRLAKAVSIVDLLFELTPEKVTRITLQKSKNNQFSFAFEPWIAEVFFSNFRLRVQGGSLEGKHPLLPGERFHYSRVE